VEYHVAFPEYFEVMRIPTIAGEIPPDGWETPELVPAVVNQRAAESFWPGRDPVGARFTFGRYGDADAIEMQVAAVVGNILDDGFAAAPDATVYVPFGAIPQRGMAVVARAAGEPGRLLSGIREAVSSVDPDIPAGDLRPLDGLLAESVARPRAASAISAAFALIAVLVACVGIYGVLSYAVQSRLREIAVRAALGASGSQITSMVLGQSTRLVALGLVLGLAGAVLAASAVSGLLFGVSRWDPLSMTMAVGILGTVATLAAWLPARRAVRVDPTEALRAD
jgi:putative ABC transport system permease protein